MKNATIMFFHEKFAKALDTHCKKYNTSSIWLWEMPPNYWERNTVQNETKCSQNLFGTLNLFIGSRENDI